MNLVFGRFQLDRERRLLLAGEEALHLAPKAFALLELLLDARPRALSKQQLIDAIWPDTLVEESNLASLVADIRTALGDHAREPRFIRTVHGFGYSFCGHAAELAALRQFGAVVFKGEEFPLREGDNVLGRDAAAGITIDDSTVSRRHACIHAGPAGLTLEDLSSKNGTTLDGQPVTSRVPVLPGQTIVLGDAHLILRAAAAGTTITSEGLGKAGE